MQFKHSIIATSVFASLVLAGCGSDSSSSNDDTTTIKVIDGYLQNAEVCIDRNENGLCDEGELLSSLTDQNGSITISADDSSYPIIARAIAGKTEDSDTAGPLGRSYELIAPSGSTVVTPFTTMAEAQGITIETLAASLNLDADVISGDYVAAKSGESQEAAKQAHLMARSLTSVLAPTTAGNDSEALAESAEAIAKIIEDSINNNEDLDKIVIEIDEDGNAQKTELIASLSQYLEGKTLFFGSLNNDYFQHEGIFKISFEDGTYTVADEDGKTDSAEYRIEGNSLIHSEGGVETKEEFIYVSANTSLAVPAQGDLNVWTSVVLDDDFEPAPFTENMLVGQTWYYLDDDSSTATPDPMLAGMTFGADGKVTISEGDEDVMLDWEITDEGTVFIDFKAHNINDNNLDIELITKDSNIMTVMDTGRDDNKESLSLMIKDKVMAESIFEKWVDEI